MSEFFLTDPDKAALNNLLKPKKQSGNRFIRFKEKVCLELQALGVPLRASEVAVIDDVGAIMKTCLIERIGPRACAEAMLPTVERIYKTDGEWHYETKKRIPSIEGPASSIEDVS